MHRAVIVARWVLFRLDNGGEYRLLYFSKQVAF